VKYSLWGFEIIVLFYYCYQIRNMKLDQINIKTESILITLEWAMFTMITTSIKIYTTFKTSSNQDQSSDFFTN